MMQVLWKMTQAIAQILYVPQRVDHMIFVFLVSRKCRAVGLSEYLAFLSFIEVAFRIVMMTIEQCLPFNRP